MANSAYVGFLGPIQFTSTASGTVFPGNVSAQTMTIGTGTGPFTSNVNALTVISGTSTPTFFSMTNSSTDLTAGYVTLEANNPAIGNGVFTNLVFTGYRVSVENYAVGYAGINGVMVDQTAVSGALAFTLRHNNATFERLRIASDGGLVVKSGANAQTFNLVNTLTELTTIAAAASTDTTIQMPAGSVVLGVSVRVTVVIPTAATFTVGDSGSAARFSTAAVSAAANSTDPGTKAGAYYNASALSIRITPNATPAANTGRVRVTIYYYTVTPPTS